MVKKSKAAKRAAAPASAKESQPAAKPRKRTTTAKTPESSAGAEPPEREAKAKSAKPAKSAKRADSKAKPAKLAKNAAEAAKPRRRARADVEVEVKLRTDALERLTESGLALEEVEGRHFEDNWVYELPDGKLRKGQYLRVRYTGDGNGSGRRKEGLMTYKGKSRRADPDAKGKHKGKKVREEIESSIGQPTKVAKIFKRLGLRRSFRYQKYRRVFRVTLEDERTLLATYDETPIGHFFELEGDAEAIESVATTLGYASGEYMSDSYVEMQLAWCRERGQPLSDMVFSPPKAERKGKKAESKPAPSERPARASKGKKAGAKSAPARRSARASESN